MLSRPIFRSYATGGATTKVASFDRFGSPVTSVKVNDEALPEVGNSHVSLSMLAAPVLLSDLAHIRGATPGVIGVAGTEGVAKVTAVGERVSGVKAGDIVVPKQATFGTWRSSAVVEAASVAKLSSSLSPEALAQLSSPVTAHLLLQTFVSVQKGDVVLHNCAEGSVGRNIVELAASRGLKVVSIVANTASPETVAALKKAGASLVLTEKELRKAGKEVKALGKAVLALDAVGGSSATEMGRLLGNGGVFVSYAKMSLAPVTLPTAPFIFNDITVRGFSLSAWRANTSAEEVTKVYSEIAGLVQQNKLSLPKAVTMPLSKVVDALAMVDQRDTAKSVVLTFDE